MWAMRLLAFLVGAFVGGFLAAFVLDRWGDPEPLVTGAVTVVSALAVGGAAQWAVGRRR
jgi:predicted MFS family arabinose efflux permease